MKILKFNKSNLLTLLLSIPFVFALIFIKSPISYNIGFSFLIYAPFYLFLYLLILFNQNKYALNYFVIFFTLVSLLSILFSVLFQSKLDLIYSAGTIVLAILLFSIVNKDLFLKIINISTFIIFLLLIGSLITFIEFIQNGIPQNYYIFPNGREIYLGRFSFGDDMSTPLGDTFFRPSSIYDEAGAFSFVIVFIVAIRDTLNMS